ncbi:MAG: NUDIX hydrolase [Aquificota bacterium]|nr:NUDIX hydrolase [Aquificota bacterium]
MRREFSAGGVLFRGDKVLLIKNPSGVWTFPKGLVEKDERPEETAVREVLEETGVEGEIVKPLGEITYWYTLKGERVFKRVRYYLMRYRKGEPKPSREVLDAGFFPLEEAWKLIKYKGDKEILSRAQDQTLQNS